MEPCPADVQRGVQGLDFTEVQPVLDAMLVRGRTVGCPAPGIHLGGLRPQGCMLRPVRAVGHVAACGIEYGVGSRGRHGVLVIVLPDELRRKAQFVPVGFMEKSGKTLYPVDAERQARFPFRGACRTQVGISRILYYVRRDQSQTVLCFRPVFRQAGMSNSIVGIEVHQCGHLVGDAETSGQASRSKTGLFRLSNRFSVALTRGSATKKC